MLDQLLETKQVRQRKPFGTTVSVVLHLAVIAAAVQLTQRTIAALPKPVEVMVLQPTKRDDPKPLEQTHPVDAVARVPSRAGQQEIVPPIVIAVDLPPVDMSARPTRADDWTGSRPCSSDGVPDGTGPTLSDAPFFVFQVDKPAAALPGTAQPAYPATLAASGVEGDVLVQFVVDTLGRAELASFKVLKASHEAFGVAVRQSLPRMRFLPAESGGRKVRMLVLQPFGFALNR